MHLFSLRLPPSQQTKLIEFEKLAAGFSEVSDRREKAGKILFFTKNMVVSMKCTQAP